jgi:hypothetical protein
MPPDNRQHICTRGVGLGVPSRPLDWSLPIGMQRMNQPRHHGVETDQTRRGMLDGTIRPLALGVEAQMGMTLLEGRIHGPACDAPWPHCPWSIVGAGRAGGSWHQAPVGIVDQHPADGPPRRAHALPPPCPAGHVQLPSAAMSPSARVGAARACGPPETPAPAAARAHLAPAAARWCPVGAARQAQTRRQPSAAGPPSAHPRAHTPGPVRGPWRVGRRCG